MSSSMSSSSLETLTAEPLSGGSEFKAQPAPTPTAAAVVAPTNTTTIDDGLQQPPPKSNHALFTMLDYTLTPLALAVLISLVLVALGCLALMAWAVNRTLWDKSKGKANADNLYDDSKQRQQHQQHRQVGGGDGSRGNTAIIFDISDGSRNNRPITEGASKSNTSSRSTSSGSMSCLVGLLVAASFIGIAVGMAFAIDRTVVALC